MALRGTVPSNGYISKVSLGSWRWFWSHASVFFLSLAVSGTLIHVEIIIRNPIRTEPWVNYCYLVTLKHVKKRSVPVTVSLGADYGLTKSFQ